MSIELWNYRKSETPSCVDIDVVVRGEDDNGTFIADGEITVGHDGNTWIPYGDSPDLWISGEMLAWMRESLSDEMFSALCRDIRVSVDDAACKVAVAA